MSFVKQGSVSVSSCRGLDSPLDLVAGFLLENVIFAA